LTPAATNLPAPCVTANKDPSPGAFVTTVLVAQDDRLNTALKPSVFWPTAKKVNWLSHATEFKVLAKSGRDTFTNWSAPGAEVAHKAKSAAEKNRFRFINKSG
jgi:hypothetical protein